jgi:hypothetical protein
VPAIAAETVTAPLLLRGSGKRRASGGSRLNPGASTAPDNDVTARGVLVFALYSLLIEI